MTDQNPIHSETQHERWLKYGGNVVLVSAIVIALAALVIYAAEKKSRRIDTTASGLYSLKPQTLSVIRENKQPITIISLYTKAKKGQSDDDTTTDDSTAPTVDQPGVVADLLEEYRTRGSNIKTENIDPVLNPGKVEDLINDVSEQYGGEIDKYKKFTTDVKPAYANISKLANDQLEIIKKLPLDKIQSDDVRNSVGLAIISVQEIPRIMKQAQDEYTHALKQKPPDYKGITDSVGQTMAGLSGIVGKVIDGFNVSKDDKDVPDAIRLYMTTSLPKYTELKKDADDLLTRQKGLGELKLDTLRDALKQKNPILVRGDKEWRVIPYDKVWKTDARDLRNQTGDTPPKPRFAGEQMITTAILSLDQPTKPKVCFVRSGGPPLTDFGGRLNSVADRLRDYNFEVTEKDLTGMYAMQAMQQQQEAPPEPADDQIADAVWVVDGAPAQQNPMMGGPPTSIAAKVAQHMTNGFHYVDGKKVPGGSALMLFLPHGDTMAPALQPLGITARTDAIAVHKMVKEEGEADGDQINQALRRPFVFIITKWGDSMITQPLASLESVLVAACPIQVSHTDGVVSTAILPVPGAPTNPECWGETDFQSVEGDPKFNKDTDIAPPLFAGACADKSGQRVVCMGSEQTFMGASGDVTSGIVDLPDMTLSKRTGVYVPQFPGSADFFMNSVFWLSHEEPMIAISPAAMNVSRISDMSAGALGFWRIGVLLIGLPALVLAAGAGVYFSRRD
jgi:hypothetical protein